VWILEAEETPLMFPSAPSGISPDLPPSLTGAASEDIVDLVVDTLDLQPETKA
jgi:hypothetical protein